MKLDFYQHGKYTGSAGADRQLAEADPLISYEDPKEYIASAKGKPVLLIDGIRIDYNVETRINYYPHIPNLTNAQFKMMDFGIEVICFHEPVIERLFWLGCYVTVFPRRDNFHLVWADSLERNKDTQLIYKKTIAL